MPNYNFTFDQDIIDTVVTDLAEAPRRLQTFVRDTIYQQIEQDILPLKTEPPGPDYPFIWSHEPAKQARARAWYFANVVKKGGNAGGKYQRTHGLVQGWQVDINAFRSSIMISIFNPAVRAVKWAQSVFQVPSHKRSGWVEYEGVLLEAEEKAENTIIDAWFNLLIVGKP